MSNLLETIGDLSDDELRNVGNLLKFRKSLSRKKTSAKEYRNEQHFHDVLKVLLEKNGSGLQSYARMEKSDLGKNLAEFTEILDEYLNSAMGGKIFRIQVRRKMYKMILEVLIDSMKSRNIPIGVKSVLNQKYHVIGIFNTAFPGYAEAGLLRKLI